MKKSKLIELLKSIPGDPDVVFPNFSWRGGYLNIGKVSVKKLVTVTGTIDEPNSFSGIEQSKLPSAIDYLVIDE